VEKKSVQTIEDIARLAKVSKSTVSRALNDSPLVKEETKELIQGIARQYDFRLNVPARQLSLQRSRTIAFITHAHDMECFSMDDLFGLEIMGGVSGGLHANDYDMLVVHVDPRNVDWAHQYLDSHRVDGFILMTSSRKQAHIKALAKMGAPFIVWGVPMPNYSYCSVCGDNFNGGRLATEHLIRSGRQRIAFLGGPADELEVQRRYEGYAAALQDAGRDIDPDLLAYGDFHQASGAAAMQQLLVQTPDLDAVFVNSDLMAIAAINVIHESGKRVPDDIAVVGYDDVSIAAFNSLPLTTIRQNVPLAGRLLAQNLIQYLQTGLVTNVTIPVELVVRKSA
jgi:DNA-binding LacI/PurR family transcriptional regulator